MSGPNAPTFPTRRRSVFAAAAALAVLAGCARPEPAARAPLSEAQRDSVLATQPIPGAPAVGAALEASERASVRAAGMDTLPR